MVAVPGEANHFANARRNFSAPRRFSVRIGGKLMKKLAIIAICLLFAAPALAQAVGEKSGVNSLLGLSPSTADFVKEAAVGDMFEIQASQLAAERADGPTKAFASQMITDHQKTSNELKAMVQDIPTALDSSRQKMLDKLVGLNGADFTKQYQSDQVSAHKDAVSLFQRYAKGGDNAALKDWAAKMLPDLEQHLQMAQDLYK
jgi:putative membrane protein